MPSDKPQTPLELAQFILQLSGNEERVEVELAREVVRLSSLHSAALGSGASCDGIGESRCDPVGHSQSGPHDQRSVSDAACIRIIAASVAEVGMPDTADQLRAIAERMEASPTVSHDLRTFEEWWKQAGFAHYHAVDGLTVARAAYFAAAAAYNQSATLPNEEEIRRIERQVLAESKAEIGLVDAVRAECAKFNFPDEDRPELHAALVAYDAAMSRSERTEQPK